MQYYLKVLYLAMTLVIFSSSSFASNIKPAKTNLDSLSKKQCCLGWREWIKLPALFKERLMAKVDSGAKTSSLHAENLQYFEKENEEWVKFEVFPKRSSKKTKYTIEAKVIETKNIRSSNGKMSIRPVIKTPISIGGIKWNIEVTLVDRSLMGYRMLLGRTAFEKKFLIDSGKSFIFSEKLKQEVKTSPLPKKTLMTKLFKLIQIDSESVTANILKSFLILFLAFLIKLYSNFMLNKREFRSESEKLRTKSLIKRILLIVSFTLLLFIWLNEFRAISIYLMAMSVAVVLTMREAIKNLHGGMHLLSSRPFKVGDIIQIKTHTGEVIQTDFMSTKILDSSSPYGSSIITLPNSLFLSSAIINKTSRELKKENIDPIVITYHYKEDKNWKKREDIFQDIIAQFGNKDSTKDSMNPEFFYSTIAPDKIQLKIKFILKNVNKQEVESKIIRDFLHRYYSE